MRFVFDEVDCAGVWVLVRDDVLLVRVLLVLCDDVLLEGVLLVLCDDVLLVVDPSCEDDADEPNNGRGAAELSVIPTLFVEGPGTSEATPAED